MRRLVLPAILFLAAAHILEGAPKRRSASPAPVVWIDPAFSESTPGWGLYRFSTIGSAVAAAVPGSHLMLAPATYRERVVVTKTLFLSGAGPQSTIIDGEGSTPLTFQNASGGGATRLTLKGAGKGGTDAGLVIRNSSGIAVRAVDIRENGRAGVYVESSQRIAIAQSAITGTDGEEGIQFRRCHDCAIEDSVVSYANPITLRGSMRARIERNRLAAIAPGQTAAIFVHLGSNNAVIRGNELTGDDVEANPCTMIRVMRSHGTLIENNTIERGRIGIWIALSNGTVLAGNSIRDYGDGDGVTLFLSNDSSIVNNTIGSAVRHPFGGVILLDSHRNTIAANRISDGSRGISLHHGSTANRVEGNDVRNVRYALVTDGAPGNTLVRNNAGGSVLAGFDNAANRWSEEGKGNWWSDYAASDANGDGVGDAPHPLGGGGRDDAPLAAALEVASVPVPAPATYAALTEVYNAASIGTATTWQGESRSYTSVQVESGGTLVMDGVSLTIGESMNADMAECGLRVRAGGTLRISNSRIQGNGFYLCVERGGKADVRGSELRRMGIWHSAFNSRGDDSIFENNVVLESIHGAQLNPDTKGGRITGNRFVNPHGGIGIWGSDAEVRDNEIVNPIATGIYLFTGSFSNIGGNRLLDNEVSNAWHVALELNEQANRDAQVIYGNSFTGPAERPRVFSPWSVQWDDGLSKGNHWGGAYLDEIPSANRHATVPGVWDTPYRLSASAGVDRYPLVCRPKATASAPAAPTLKAPAAGATNVSSDAAFEWDPIAGAVAYRLVVSADAAFRSDVSFNRGDVMETRRVVKGLARNTNYYWRVLATTNDCDGAWSQTASFRTAP